MFRRRTLLDQATIKPGFRVLDIGCGTGTLAILIKSLHPGVDVVGLDPDPKALAERKEKRNELTLEKKFPAISKALTHPELQSTILDGEIVRPTASGRNVICRECCEPRYEPDHAATHALVHSLAEDASS